jgi:hypothetical protein
MYMVEASLYKPILVGWFSNLNLCPPARPASKCKGDAAEGYHPVCTSEARKTGDTDRASARADPRMRHGRRTLGANLR